jgi:GT2 family glycosyltransferase
MSVCAQNHPVGELSSSTMQLSILIICWNDWKTIEKCLRSIHEGTHSTRFEIIASDSNSIGFPGVRIIDNGSNLGFAKGNNAGIRAAFGKYVLVLNPDTVVHKNALDKLVAFAEHHLEAGGFGCRILNPDCAYQASARFFPTLPRYWMAALGLRYLDPYLPFFTITGIRMRQMAFAIIGVVRPADTVRERLKMYRVVARWNIDLDPVRFVERGEEPRLKG